LLAWAALVLVLLGAAAAGGASMLTVAGGSVAALLYSSKLNDGEDTELLNNRLKKGGGEAVGAAVDFFMQKGWTREQAEGLAANLEQESGFKADAEGDGGQAYGLAQWHPDRQAEFDKKYGKDIRKSTGAEQLEFINHELTRGNEKSAGGKLKMADNAYDAAAIVSREYERPADKEGEADRRGERARSYGIATPKPDQLFGGEIDSAKSKAQEPAYDELGSSRKVQREAPREHTANSVVQPAAQDSLAPSPGGGPTAAQPSYTDSRVYHINGADTEKVRQVLNESMSKMTEQTMQDFRSPEQ
jgi:hypothetical protein